MPSGLQVARYLKWCLCSKRMRYNTRLLMEKLISNEGMPESAPTSLRVISAHAYYPRDRNTKVFCNSPLHIADPPTINNIYSGWGDLYTSAAPGSWRHRLRTTVAKRLALRGYQRTVACVTYKTRTSRGTKNTLFITENIFDVSYVPQFSSCIHLGQMAP